MQLNRVVALATPLFAAAAGWVATWLAENVPGVSIDQSALQEVFIAGALIALAPAAQWLHGWQKWEQREADAAVAAEAVDAQVEAAEFSDLDDVDLDAEFDDDDDLDA